MTTKSKLPPSSPCIDCNDHPRKLRGLCSRCYAQFRYARDVAIKRGKSVAAFEATLIKAGRLLPSRQGKKSTAGPNQFLEVIDSLPAAANQKNHPQK